MQAVQIKLRSRYLGRKYFKTLYRCAVLGFSTHQPLVPSASNTVTGSERYWSCSTIAMFRACLKKLFYNTMQKRCASLVRKVRCSSNTTLAMIVLICCVCVFMYLCSYVFMCLCIYMYIYVCMYLCLYVFMYLSMLCFYVFIDRLSFRVRPRSCDAWL